MLRFKRLAALLLTMLLVCLCAIAQASGVSIRGVHPCTGEPVMYFEVRALDSAGRGVHVNKSDLRFTAGKDDVALKLGEVPSGNTGHIIVVDTSLYYFGTKYIKEENIRDIISMYLSRVNASDRVMFVLATEGQPEVISYRSVSDARNYVQNITLKPTASAKIKSAIYTAFQYAANPSTGNPAFNSVFIVADPDLQSNDDNEHSLNDSVTLRSESGRNFDVVVAVPYRQSFVEGTSEQRRTTLQSGFAEFSVFTGDVGGAYVQLLQSGNDVNNKIETEPLRTALSDRIGTSNYYAVDFSPLAGMFEEEDEQDEENPFRPVEVSITYDGSVTKAQLMLNTALLPEPQHTPTPTPNPDPTPTPEPTPVVRPGQGDTLAMQAIHALNKLNYLHKTDFETFDNECYIAYVDFCLNNGIDPRDGIYTAAYDLLLSGNAVADVTPTPEPTPTPAPTPLVGVGQADATAMKAVHALYKLNYLTSTSFETFDNECFIAYMEFCDKNGIDPRDGIYEKGYGLLISDQAIGITRATPVPTATPEPTIPPEGYSINDVDTEHSGGYIAQIQAILKSLNCYTDTVDTNVGRMDQSTIDAINLYCTTYNWRNDRVDGVTKSICLEILTSGPNLVPRATPKPTLREKSISFLTRDIRFLGLRLKMWVPALLCVVLVFLILVLLVLFRGGKKPPVNRVEPTPPLSGNPSVTPPVSPIKPADPAAQAANPPGWPQPQAAESFDFGDGETTTSGYFGKPVELRIENRGSVDHREVELGEGRPFVIGRKEDCDLTLVSQDKAISRKHALLIYQNDQVYLRDVSTYHNTLLNGMKTHTSDRDNMGTLLTNGDVISIGTYRITISW